MTDETKEIINVVQELFLDLKNDINGVKNDVNDLKNDVNDLKARVSSVENTVARMEMTQENTTNRLASIESTVARIETTQENVTNKKIQLLAEGFQSVPEMSEELHSLSNDMEIVKFGVDIVKKVVTTHSTELNKLGRAK